jgi:hypothetical protein
MRVIDGALAWCWNVRETIDLPTALYVHREVTSSAELHDEIYISLGTNYVYELGDMSMMQTLEDLDLGLEILEEFGGEDLAGDSLDCNLFARYLEGQS